MGVRKKENRTHTAGRWLYEQEDTTKKGPKKEEKEDRTKFQRGRKPHRHQRRQENGREGRVLHARELSGGRSTNKMRKYLSKDIPDAAGNPDHTDKGKE